MDTNIIDTEQCLYCMVEFDRRSVNKNTVLLMFNGKWWQISRIWEFFACFKEKIMKFMC